MDVCVRVCVLGVCVPGRKLSLERRRNRYISVNCLALDIYDLNETVLVRKINYTVLSSCVWP